MMKKVGFFFLTYSIFVFLMETALAQNQPSEVNVLLEVVGGERIRQQFNQIMKGMITLKEASSLCTFKNFSDGDYDQLPLSIKRVNTRLKSQPRHIVVQNYLTYVQNTMGENDTYLQCEAGLKDQQRCKDLFSKSMEIKARMKEILADLNKVNWLMETLYEPGSEWPNCKPEYLVTYKGTYKAFGEYVKNSEKFAELARLSSPRAALAEAPMQQAARR